MDWPWRILNRSPWFSFSWRIWIWALVDSCLGIVQRRVLFSQWSSLEAKMIPVWWWWRKQPHLQESFWVEFEIRASGKVKSDSGKFIYSILYLYHTIIFTNRTVPREATLGFHRLSHTELPFFIGRGFGAGPDSLLDTVPTGTWATRPGTPFSPAAIDFMNWKIKFNRITFLFYPVVNLNIN